MSASIDSEEERKRVQEQKRRETKNKSDTDIYKAVFHDLVRGIPGAELSDEERQAAANSNSTVATAVVGGSLVGAATSFAAGKYLFRVRSRFMNIVAATAGLSWGASAMISFQIDSALEHYLRLEPSQSDIGFLARERLHYYGPKTPLAQKYPYLADPQRLSEFEAKRELRAQQFSQLTQPTKTTTPAVPMPSVPSAMNERAAEPQATLRVSPVHDEAQAPSSAPPPWNDSATRRAPVLDQSSDRYDNSWIREDIGSDDDPFDRSSAFGGGSRTSSMPPASTAASQSARVFDDEDRLRAQLGQPSEDFQMRTPGSARAPSFGRGDGDDVDDDQYNGGSSGRSRRTRLAGLDDNDESRTTNAPSRRRRRRSGGNDDDRY
jgi:hypothetical protein